MTRKISGETMAAGPAGGTPLRVWLMGVAFSYSASQTAALFNEDI